MKEIGAVEFIKNESGTRLALMRVPADTPPQKTGQVQRLGPVLLAHGTFSNHRSVAGLAQYLSNTGYDCWTLDFQGHGLSDKPKIEPNFDSMCIEDAAAALDHMKVLYPSQPTIWVGHSAGGLAVLALLSRKPEYQSSIKSIVTLGSQATHAAKVRRHRFVIQVSKLITKIVGLAPGKYLKLGPENEFGSVMAQWYGWSLTGKWLGDDGFNYLDAVANITSPILMLSGSGDTFIAPPEGCRALFNQLGSSNKHYAECGLLSGFSEDYNHPRIVSSRSASREIWPLIVEWLAEPLTVKQEC